MRPKQTIKSRRRKKKDDDSGWGGERERQKELLEDADERGWKLALK